MLQMRTLLRPILLARITYGFLPLLIVAAVHAKPTTLLNGKASLELPPGFRPMSRAEISKKFSGVQPPQRAWTNSSRLGATVAVTAPAVPMTPAQLPQFKTLMERYLAGAQRGVQWRRREFITLNGRRWVRFEFTSKAPDAPLWNDMYFTSFQNRLLAFNFNTVLSQKTKWQPLFLLCRNSIRLRS
jgi:hypothetical protein